ncbi:MAG TPA: hypothetical protein VM509_14440 [Planctomycetota bacterium]|nr:hypothetical protein [Planctomycetota bacterium]
MAGSSSRPRDSAIAAVFVAVLFAPAVAFVVRPKDEGASASENRALAEFPRAPGSVLDWAAWPRAFESWHDDHFGLRSTLLRAHSVISVFCLNSSASPLLVLGREHWIYNPGAGIDLWRGAQPFTERELEAWRHGVESRARELEQRGIAYSFVLVPSKSEIYPEFLPERYRQGGPSRLDQLSAHLGQHKSTALLDLRAALREEKLRDEGDDHAFYPLGTHWSERGAWAGTRAIVHALEPRFPAIAAVDDKLAALELIDDPGDTLARQMDLSDLLTQRVRAVKFATPRELDLIAWNEHYVTVEQPDDSLPRAVIFHDSFGQPLPPLLGRHFSRAVFLWQPDIDLELVDREKPDIVLQIMSDRVLALPAPRELDAAGASRVKLAYQASNEIVLELDVEANSPRIQSAGGGRVSVRGTGAEARVACSTVAMSDTFLLPEFVVREGRHPIVRIEFESSVASTTSLFFQTRVDTTFSRRRQLLNDTHIGLNDLYIEIVDPDFAGRLMFRPAQEVGTFLIKTLEVRLVPD